MGKLVHLMLYVFAFVGLMTTVVGGYTYISNADLFGQFWDVKDDYKSVPEDRRQEVVAELPARISFEREVADDLSALPEERRMALYEQLSKSRDAVFFGFKARIHAEAEIARKFTDAGNAADVTKEIETKLGKVNTTIDLTGKKKVQKSQLSDVEAAWRDVSKAADKYDAAHGGAKTKHVNTAIAVLSELYKMGDKVVAARKMKLTGDDKSRLDRFVMDAKRMFFNVKKFTPGLAQDNRYSKFAQGIPRKLNK